MKYRKKSNEELLAESDESRKLCHKNEKIVHLTLNNCIYQQLGMTVQVHYDKEGQIKGRDITVTYQGKTYVVDEKADTVRQLRLGASNYDKSIRDAACTFCRELSFMQYRENGIVLAIPRRIWGWGEESRRKEALNTHFMLIWLNFDKDDKGIITKIHATEVALISDEAWVKIVKEAFPDFTGEEISDMAIALVPDDADPEKSCRIQILNYGNRDVHITVSRQLPEKPVNLVTSKFSLRQNAIFAYAFQLEGELGKEKILLWRPTKRLPNMPSRAFQIGGWFTPEEWDEVHNRTYQEWLVWCDQHDKKSA